MASLLILGGIGTVGFLLSKFVTNSETTDTLDNNMVNNTKKFIKNNSIVHKTNIQENLENQSVNNNAKKSNEPKTRFRIRGEDRFKETVDKLNKSEVIISPLTGIEIPLKKWSPDAKPFYKGRVKQSIELDKSNYNVGWMTGTDTDVMKDKEIAKPMFKPVKNIGNVNGVSIYNSDLKHRYNSSKYITGERPFEQMQVGPGLNKGYTSKGSGGFHQIDTRDYAMPKNVDQLRSLNNPKLTYKSRVAAPKKSIDSRGKMGLMFKNKVETSYNQSHEDLLVTTGAVIKEMGRSTIIIKNTNRKYSGNIMGNPKYNISKAEVESNYKVSNKLSYCNDEVRNLDGQHIGQNEQDDFGKKSFFLDLNKRNVTELRTHTTNVMKAVKAIVTPVTDLFKKTIKETTEVNEKMGNMGNNVSRVIMKDKDNQQLNRTLRETLDPEATNRNFNTNDKNSYLLDHEDVMKTTIKETTANNNHSGHVQNKADANGYITNVHDAPLTQKEGTHIEYMGTGDSIHQEHKLYDYIINNKTSGCREETLEGRAPTTSNVSLTHGASSLNVVSGKNDCDYLNDRGLIKTTMNYIGTNIEQLKNTHIKLKHQPNAARYDHDLLNQLKNNPYVTERKF